MAEALRFELRRDLHPLSVFKTDPFNHLGMLPFIKQVEFNLSYIPILHIDKYKLNLLLLQIILSTPSIKVLTS